MPMKIYNANENLSIYFYCVMDFYNDNRFLTMNGFLIMIMDFLLIKHVDIN